MTTEAQMVAEALERSQELQTFIGLLTGLRGDEVKLAIEEILEEPC